MPGILIALGEFDRERLAAATRKLTHFSGGRSEIKEVAANVAIGWAGSPSRIDSTAWTSNSGRQVHVFRYGYTTRDGSEAALIGADAILRDYLNDDVRACTDYEGSFVIAICDTHENRLYVIPDRLCTQPIYYCGTGKSLLIGPEVKALCTARGLAPRFSNEGLVGFLTAGYNLGRQTLFAGVERLELGALLVVSLDLSSRASTRRFWKLEFSSAEKFTRRHDAEDALFHSIKHAHQLHLRDNPEFQILLSGGLDSRGMLGICSVLGTMPRKAVSYGLLQNVPRSDGSIATALAGIFGVPLEFVVTNTDDFVDNCEKWSYYSELANDNFGWYSEGFGALNHFKQTGYSCTLIGDECWGHLGFAANKQQAYSRVMPSGVPALLLAVVQKSQHSNAISAYENSIESLMRDCSDTDWTERKDFLYLHGRAARFLFSLGYHRESVTELRRPFLARGVIDIVRRLPNEFRVFKNLYTSMLRRHLPTTMHLPNATVSSLPDWGYDLRTGHRLKEFFHGLLHDSMIHTGALAGLIDAGPFRALRDAFLAEKATPIERRARMSALMKAHVLEIVWRQPYYKYIVRSMHQDSPKVTRHEAMKPVDILRRIAILVLLERQLDRLRSV